MYTPHSHTQRLSTVIIITKQSRRKKNTFIVYMYRNWVWLSACRSRTTAHDTVGHRDAVLFANCDIAHRAASGHFAIHFSWTPDTTAFAFGCLVLSVSIGWTLNCSRTDNKPGLTCAILQSTPLANSRRHPLLNVTVHQLHTEVAKEQTAYMRLVLIPIWMFGDPQNQCIHCRNVDNVEE